MDFFIEREQRILVKSGAKSSFLLPYPYKQGHFCVYYGADEKKFEFLSDEAYVDAAASWLELSVEPKERDDEVLQLITYKKLMQNANREFFSAQEDEKKLFRLLMDAHLTGIFRIAMVQLRKVYSRNCRSKRSLYWVKAAVNKLLEIKEASSR